MGHNAIRESNKGKKLFIYAILVFQLVIIGSLIRGIQLSYKSRERLEILNETKNKLEEEKNKLEADVLYVQSDYYIEKIAREELQKAKPGEEVVILPDDRTQDTGHSMQENKSKERQLKNWEKWWKLLLE